ncbi:hypothetical protein H8S45_12290 [Agathobaculum sp. NSJ-28]|uniref:Uncharacterized protein n=1 Tax=Agathobaculum faecis TaxID=2763013 RepID=A0A923LXI9_9FIRM|nr:MULTISPECIES: hypothetical protein [Agathobaculum]MBC5726231.1 hypothetical protein [Agathobaculum faecis]
MSGFTMGCSHALRSKGLSLAAKGLYLVISSFCGMPGWRLSKSQLVQFCESRYALEKAWHDLLEAGYLKHRFSQTGNSGAFVHTYDLLQLPEDSPAYQYAAPSGRTGGDCRFRPAGDTMRDFTRIPNAVLRSKTIPLAVKGLFGVVLHLTLIPHFHLNPEGVRAFCAERLKRFSSVWRALKISGLLKQHRYPTGQEDGFSYQYELLAEPDQETPYLTNHHADGTVSTVKTIAGYLSHAGKKLRALRPSCSKTAHRRGSNASVPSSAPARKAPYAPSQAEIEAVRRRIDAGRLEWQYDAKLVDMAAGALAEIENAPELTVSKRTVPLDERAPLASAFTYDDMSSFLRTKIDLSRAGNPAAYLRAVLLKWMQERASAGNQRAKPLSDWEQEWLERIKDVRCRRLAEEAGQKNTSTT